MQDFAVDANGATFAKWRTIFLTALELPTPKGPFDAARNCGKVEERRGEANGRETFGENQRHNLSEIDGDCGRDEPSHR